MIKFFRHIRQKLLSENKVSKYLLYAIGEIVLVVIGILIALSVNNWKETSSQRKIEKLFLVDLLHDLTLDSIQLESMLEIDTERFRTKPLLLKFLRKESTLPDSIEVYFDKQFNVPMTPFTPNITTIEEGKISGGLAILRDRQLRRSIVDLYANYELYKVSESIYLEKFEAQQEIIFPLIKDLRHPTFKEISILQEHPAFINMLDFNYGIGRHRQLIFIAQKNAELLARISSYGNLKG